MIGGWQRWSLSEPPCGLGLTSLSRLFGACTHGYTGSCSCVSRTSVARAASARTASCCCMSSTSLARGHIPRRSLKSTQSLGAAGAGCGWHHRRAGARVWLRGTRAGMHAKKGGRNKKMAAETWIRTPGWYIAQPGYTPLLRGVHRDTSARHLKSCDSLRILYIYMAEHAKPRSRRWHRSRQCMSCTATRTACLASCGEVICYIR